MNTYKALFIINPGKEESLQEVSKSIAEAIASQNGRVEKEGNWGRRNLAYPVKKSREGIFYELDFSIDPSKISVLTNIFKLKGDILRVMITKK